MANKECKRLVEFRKKVQAKNYAPVDAFKILTENANARESIDIAIVLEIDPKKSDQVVKGVVEHMPAGLGKKIVIGVFTKGDAQAAIEAGADHAGFDDLFAKVKNEEIDCDVYLATIDIMPELTKLGLGRILKGKMPNPKFGTVIEAKDMAKAIKAQKAGQLAFRSNGKIVHCSIGRASFTAQDLFENYKALLKSVNAARPSIVKPHSYFKRVFVSSTMGPSIALEFAEQLKEIRD
jgi:large subunit ribosomal protein L1